MADAPAGAPVADTPAEEPPKKKRKSRFGAPPPGAVEPPAAAAAALNAINAIAAASTPREKLTLALVA